MWNSDSGLTWEANKTSPGGAKPNAPLDHEELEHDGQRAHQGVSARLAYLASGRPDIAFALQGRQPRSWQSNTRRPQPCRSSHCKSRSSHVTIDGHSDTDAAGCPKTRRSTSGGTLHVGRHTWPTWSSTQRVVSLGSGIRILQHRTLCE